MKSDTEKKQQHHYGQLPYSKRIYSQHDEDGIIEHLIDALTQTNKTCVEIGWGTDRKTRPHLDVSINCTQNLIQNKGYTGIAYDAKIQNIVPKNVTFYHGKVNPNMLDTIINQVPIDPDFFSLDIDSFDYEIMKGLFDLGFSPKIVCAEINRAFGPHVNCSMPYVDAKEYDKSFFHGVSFTKYKNFFTEKKYRFFTLDSSNVNVFYYDPRFIDEKKLSTTRIKTLQENFTIQQIYNKFNENIFWKDRVDDIFK